MNCLFPRAQGLSKRGLLVVLLAFFCGISGFAFASTNDPGAYFSRSWQTEDGLPSSFVQSIVQTRDGYIWVATHDGLAKFDGVKFSLADPLLSPASDESSFTSLFEDRDGRMWVAREDGYLFHAKSGVFTEKVLPGRAAGEYVTSILQSRDGALWLGIATNGVLRLKDGRCDRWHQRNGLAHFSVRALCEDAAGTVWIATGAGLNQWDGERLKTITVRDGLLHNSIRALCADRAGNLWIGSHFGLTKKSGTTYKHFTKREGLSGSIVTAIIEDRNGQIWVGTFNGLNRIVGDKIFAETQNDGGSFDRVQSLMEDREGNIWVGTRDGLFQLRPRVITPYWQQRGLTHSSATSVMQDQDGNIWAGFWGGGLNKIDPSGRVSAFTLREGLSSDLVLTVHQSRRGNIWIGTDYDGGLNLYRDGEFVHFRQSDGLRDDGIKAMQDDSGGNLWIGTRTALLQLHDNKFHRFTSADGLPADSVEAILEGRDGTLWLGTSGGLASLRDGRFNLIGERDGLPHPAVSAIYEDVEGVLWLGTRGGGLTRLKNGKFFAYTTRNGLYSDELNGVVADDLGYLWMSCRKGIFRVSFNELAECAEGKISKVNCVVFDKSDGMLSVECKGAGRTAAWKTSEGRLLFPTSKGIVAVDPSRVTLNPAVPPVVIEGAAINGDPIDVSTLQQFTTDRPELTFAFTALSFTDPEKVRFKYKLEGLDDDWVEAEKVREARYVHVPPGNYCFRVIAANNDGIWNEKGASFVLTLTPPFWRSSWFLSVCVLSIIGMTTGAVRYISVRKYKARLRAIEQEHAVERERIRIAQDMHDELGARMTEVMLLTELASNAKTVPTEMRPQLNRISQAAREVVRNLDAVVWTVNPENDSIDRVVGYVQEFAQSYLELANIRCWFDFPEKVPNWPMSSEVRHHLFLVLRESLNNIVKHSGATEVRLRLCIDEKSLQFSIHDNGKGFCIDESSGFGNGLKNMHRRLETIRGELQMQSERGKGTEIRIHILLEELTNRRSTP